MVVKALLLGLIAALAALEGNWLGECKLREPLVTGFLVGLVLGDVKQGVIIGGQLQLIWMGATGIGLAPGLQIGAGGTLGAAFAIMTGTGLETAIAIGLPASLLMQSLGTLVNSFFSYFMHKADDYAAKADDKGMIRMHYACLWVKMAINIIPVFLTVYFGADLVQNLVNNIPAWVNAGLSGVSAVITTLGFAMLMQILMEPRLIPFFAIGFALSVYLGLDMVAITILSVSVAVIIFIAKMNGGNSVLKEEDDEL